MYVENEDRCANCTEHEDTNNSWKIYCKVYKQYFDKTETCQYQQRIKRSEDSENCYITTIVCGLLGFDDKCNILETLREFRKIMQHNPQYKGILFEYDTLGPKIAAYINDDKDYELANGMLNFYILPIVGLIRNEEYDVAVKKYITMTKSLENYYGINEDTIIPDNYDQKNGGHGKVLII